MIRLDSPHGVQPSKLSYRDQNRGTKESPQVNGILILDKPKGVTSQKAVEKVKRALNIKRAGHTGTLDPFATGVLPVCINDATKVIPFLDENFKEYEATLRLGVETDTMDETGSTVGEKEVGGVTGEDVLNSFPKFTGKISQIPPMFSALKKDGVRLYKLARRGKEVERSPRTVIVEKLDLLEFNPPFVKFSVRCSRGTYIRVLASGIGNELGCGGHLTELRRTRSGMFQIEDSVILEGVRWGNVNLVSLQRALNHMEEISITEKVARQIRDGKQIKNSDFELEVSVRFRVGDRVRFSYHSDLICIAEALVGVGDIDKMDDREVAFKLIRVFN